MGRQCGTSIRKSWVYRSSVWLCLMTKASTSALERSSHRHVGDDQKRRVLGDLGEQLEHGERD